MSPWRRRTGKSAVLVGERLEVSAFVGDSSRLPPRAEVVERLFALSPPWLRAPGEILRLDLEAAVEEYGRWSTPPPPLVTDPLPPSQLLFVYDANRETPACVSVHEAPPSRAVYDVSVPFSRLRGTPSLALERWVRRLYELFTEYGECVVTVASEAGLSPDRPAADALAYALSPTMNAAWVIAPRDLFASDTPDTPDPDASILIRRHDPITPPGAGPG